SLYTIMSNPIQQYQQQGYPTQQQGYPTSTPLPQQQQQQPQYYYNQQQNQYQQVPPSTSTMTYQTPPPQTSGVAGVVPQQQQVYPPNPNVYSASPAPQPFPTSEQTNNNNPYNPTQHQQQPPSTTAYSPFTQQPVQGMPYVGQPQTQPQPQQQYYSPQPQPTGQHYPYQQQYPQQPQQPQQQTYQQQMPNMQGLSLGPSLPNPVIPSNMMQPQATQPKGGDNRINASQVPNPATILDHGRSYVYNTSSIDTPPPSSIQQEVVDQLCSGPLFMRSTIYTLPPTDEILNSSHLPFAIHTTPLAHNNVPIIDHGAQGPVRCTRCLGYMNPNNTFINGGKFYVCKLCDYENDVPQHYFSATLANGHRTDFEQRPELQRGSYEFIAKQTNETPVIPAYIFVIEVSANTVTSGVLTTAIEAIRTVLNERSDMTPRRIGIITFDTEVHFWSFKKTYNMPQMKVVAKGSVFVPGQQDAFLVDYTESKHLVDYFFDNIANFFRHPHDIQREFAFGAAVQTAAMSLEKCGGRLFVLTTNLPKGSPGAIPKREQSKEKTMVPSPAYNSFYKLVSQHCATSNVMVDLFIIPGELVDLTTTGYLATSTGGHIHYYPHFNPDTADQLHSDLVHAATQPYGFKVAIKIRCSRGLTVSNNYGNIVEENGEIHIAGITNDKCITSLIKYDDKLKPKTKAYIQFAMMYTTIKGENRIRVHNLRFNVADTVVSLFKDADIDSIMTVLGRYACRDIITTPPSQVRTNTVDNGIELLAAYRKNCAADKAHTQLILPECFKLLPIYTLSMMKTPAFQINSNVSPDNRFYVMNLLASLPPQRIIPLIHPRVYPIHNLQANHGTLHPEHKSIMLPAFVRLSLESVTQDGVYLFENGINIYLWVQQFASQNVLQDLFAVDSVVGHNASKLTKFFQSLNGANQYHQRVENIIGEIIRLRDMDPAKQVQLVVQNDYLDSYLRQHMYEDKGLDSISYIDFLCQIHKQIQNKLS
ncbi:hypothetical protein SAMD00019534_024610, partial [Acytostelium subglobosum LB1]|uniref:hypothetical protein n=1 Tax=Acytostelium subglobosum LB1 TaxID=1410327 RepID=UPI000644CCE3